MDKNIFSNANKAFRERSYEKAVLAYRDAIEISPNFHHYYVNLAIALERLGLENEAIKAYERAVKLGAQDILIADALKRLKKLHSLIVPNISSFDFNSATTYSDYILSQSSTKDFVLNLQTTPKDKIVLKENYIKSEISQRPDTFILYRIIGNDLYPRHKNSQSIENLRFILQHEPTLDSCQKRWVVNRIFDRDVETQVIQLLEEYKYPYIHIPFEMEKYRLIGLDEKVLPTPNFLESDEFKRLPSYSQNRILIALYRLKNLYVMNNNGARNVALRDGRNRAKWVLPWDGNCFISAPAWQKIMFDVKSEAYFKYFAVPMERILQNSSLLNEDRFTNPVEEPQLLFRCDSAEEFNEQFHYGRRPKVELLWRLGVPGVWDNWKDDAWDQPRRTISPEANQFGFAGWVYRLFSGHAEQEGPDKHSQKKRSQSRNDAIIATINHLDCELDKLGDKYKEENDAINLSGNTVTPLVSLYTVTFIGDYRLLLLQIKSFLKYATSDSFVEYLIIVNDSVENNKLIKNAIKSATENTWIIGKVKIYTAEEVLGRLPKIETRGWKVQQAIKLSAYKFCTGNYVLYLDAKNHLVNTFDVGLLIRNDGRVASSKLRAKTGDQLRWLNDSFKRLNICKSGIEELKTPPTTTPYVIGVNEISGLSKEITTDWLTFFENSNDTSTEFFLLGAYVYKKFQSFDYYFVDYENLVASAFGRYPESPSDIFRVTEKIVKGETMFLGFHRARILSLTKDDPISQAFIKNWMRCGFFSSSEDAYDFLQG